MVGINSGLVMVTGEFHSRKLAVVTPEHRVVSFKIKKGDFAVTPHYKTVKAKEKSIKDVEYVTRTFSGSEGLCTDTRCGLAFDLACRLLEDGAENVRLWDYSGNEYKVTRHDLKRRQKAMAVSLRLCKDTDEPLPLKRAA